MTTSTGNMTALVTDVELRPGQLWRWAFSHNDGTWPFQRVTTEGRHVWFAGGHIMMKRGDVFTMVTVNDPGPYQMNLPKINDIGQVVSDPPKRWHVVLVAKDLVWIDHEWLEQAELLVDAE